MKKLNKEQIKYIQEARRKGASQDDLAAEMGVAKGTIVRYTRGLLEKKQLPGPDTTPLAQRFWEKVGKRGEDDCWLWKGAVDKKGFGYIFSRLRAGEGTTVAAHRLSWNFANGHIPRNATVRQKCGNKLCCNPAHLFLGKSGEK